MTKVLLFPAEETQLNKILQSYYHIIPVNISRHIGEYIFLSELLVVDATQNPQKAKNFITDINNNTGLGIAVYISKDQEKLEEEFMQLGITCIIKDSYSPLTIKNQLDKVILNEKNRKTISELRASDKNVFHNVPHKPLENHVEMTQKIFIRSVQQREVLKNFSKILASGYSMDNLLSIFVNVLQEMLKVGKVAILIEEGGVYKIKAYTGILPTIVEHILFPSGGHLVDYLRKEGTALRIERVQLLDPQLAGEMRSLGMDTAVPMCEHGRLVGIIVLNKKITGLPITDEELELVFALGNQVAVAVENTMLAELINYQRNYLKNILDNVSCGIITVTTNKNVLTYNPKAEEILGINKVQVLNRSINSLPKEIAAVLDEAIHTGNISYRQELKLENPDKFIGISVAPIKNDKGNTTGSVMIFTDLSPIKAFEQELRRMDRLDFTNTVAMRSSHELKNCLVSIKTFAQLLPERYMDQQFRDDFYLVVNKEVDRLNQVVENLLFFAQELHIDAASNDIESLIKDVINGLDKDSMLLGVEINKEYNHKGNFIDIDKDAISRAVKAVLLNSIQAMPKGGKINIVTHDFSAEDMKLSESLSSGKVPDTTGDKLEETDYLEIKITDNGVGIKPEELKKVWDPFFTTKTRGIGLGMTIIKKIVESHNGKISISSIPQKETEVVILLPKNFKSQKSKTVYFPSGRKVIV